MSPRTSPPLALAALLALLLPASVGAQERLPRVTVVGTGGTIAGVSETRTSFQDYRAGQLPIEDMVYALRPQIEEVAEVNTVQFGNRSSGGYGIPDYYDLTLAVEKALETADAAVVTSGTGTMDEIVYWLELTVQSQKPVVITGAMRPWTVIGTDAHANLFNAIVLAASGETRCFGTVLMLNDEFHAAKDVWKSDAYRLDTFISRQVGVLGWVDGLEVRTFRAPPRVQRCDDPAAWRTPFDLSSIAKQDLPRVEVFMGYQGARLDEAMAALADAGVDGMVVAGGGVSREARSAAEAKGVTFVSTQRFRSGDAHNLMPQKARLLLMLSLAFAEDGEQALEWFEEISTEEFLVPAGAARTSDGVAAPARARYPGRDPSPPSP